MPNLIWLFTIPLIFSALIFALIFVSSTYLKRLTLLMSCFPFLCLIYGQTNWIGAEVNLAWLPALSIHFHLSIDSLSLIFLFLVSIIIPISLLAPISHPLPSPNLFYGLILLLQALLIGFFTTHDLALFTFFWEAMLIPLYFLIILCGGTKRRAAALKFLVYMIAGGTLMVASTLALYLASGAEGETKTFNIEQLKSIAAQAPYSVWIFAAFMLAFAVKTPLFPFHAWLPDTYYEASTTSTILLSSLLSKAGIYGIIRIAMGFFPNLLQEWSALFVNLAVIGVLYAGLAAWLQNDYKRLIAYSSFSHVNFILAGLFIWNEIATSGAILQAFNHGIIITALFLVASWITEKIGTTVIGPYHGLAKYLPKLCWLTLFFVAASIGLPGTNSFVGEFILLFGVLQNNSIIALALLLTIILSAIYMLRWMRKIYFEEASLFQPSFVDIQLKESLIALPLICLILWIGIYPSPLLKEIKAATENIDFLNKPETF